MVGSVIVIVSWSVVYNLVYWRIIPVGSMIVIVSWAIANNVVYLRGIIVCL